MQINPCLTEVHIFFLYKEVASDTIYKLQDVMETNKDKRGQNIAYNISHFVLMKKSLHLKRIVCPQIQSLSSYPRVNGRLGEVISPQNTGKRCCCNLPNSLTIGINRIQAQNK